jgi:hypothetical protein
MHTQRLANKYNQIEHVTLAVIKFRVKEYTNEHNFETF